MCGIGGIYSYRSSQLPQELFFSFIDSMTHRGPDGRGFFKDCKESLWLGHRRLKILDLSPTGAQPMSWGNGRFTITFNGEIYNFIELRRELESLGYSFKSMSDTEVILAAYAHWGEDCQFKFNGMWAFVIWDSQEKTLFLSRDRFGVKPLHYYYDEHLMAFASEIKAFLFLPKTNISIDPNTFAYALQNPNGLEATEQTLLKGVKRLQAGCCATFSSTGKFQTKRWWNTLSHLHEVPANFSDQINEFRNLFEDACRIRMRSDVSLGSALSGGLDSSSVLTMVAKIGRDSTNRERISPEWQSAFTALYPGTSQDELPYAEKMVHHTGVQSYLCPIDASQLISNLDNALYHLEEIFELPIGPWMLYREFRSRGKIISIDGHGADELLGGYHHYTELALSEAVFPKLDFPLYKSYVQLLQSMYPQNSPHFPSSFREILYRCLRERLKMTSLEKISRSLYQQMKRLFITNQPAWIKIPQGLPSTLYTPPNEERFSLIDRTLYRDFHYYTLPTILRNFDRCSMAHGVEIRAPFLDWRLVCYAFSLPTESKINGKVTKRILRESMRGLLPESIRMRMSKVGFATPLIEWYRGSLKSYILDSVHSRSFLQSSIWDGPQICAYVVDCFHRNDYSGARRSWEFVQADRLIHLFQSKQSSE